MGQFIVKKEDFIGKGITFPIVLAGGKIKKATGLELITASIRNCLSYYIGTRFFLGEFGSRINDLLEEQNEELLANVVSTLIRDSLTSWEPRINVIEIEVKSPSPAKVEIAIFYEVIATRTTETYIWPFYEKLL